MTDGPFLELFSSWEFKSTIFMQKLCEFGTRSENFINLHGVRFSAVVYKQEIYRRAILNLSTR